MTTCNICNKKEAVARSLCHTCYCRLRHQGKLDRITPFSPELPLQFSNEQHDILIGSLLGDGFIFKYKPTHKPYFSILRKAADEEYLLWEYNKFKNFCVAKPIYKSTYDSRTNKIYFSIKFITCRSELFDSYYNNWYPNNTKIVPQNIEISPLAMAIWFCDDGCITTNKSAPHRMHLKLATHGFDQNSICMLHELLQNRYKEKFLINTDNSMSVPHMFISAGDNAARAFLNEIDSVFPESMIRKAYWRNPIARFYNNKPVRTTVWSIRKNYQ